MQDFDYMRVVKWVLIVLAAGFIGHFGKALAEYLIARARRRRARDQGNESQTAAAKSEEIAPSVKTPGSSGTNPVSDSAETKTRSKAEKKALKADLKLRKK